VTYGHIIVRRLQLLGLEELRNALPLARLPLQLPGAHLAALSVQSSQHGGLQPERRRGACRPVYKQAQALARQCPWRPTISRIWATSSRSMHVNQGRHPCRRARERARTATPCLSRIAALHHDVPDDPIAAPSTRLGEARHAQLQLSLHPFTAQRLDVGTVQAVRMRKQRVPALRRERGRCAFRSPSGELALDVAFCGLGQASRTAGSPVPRSSET
jgi:hypothetical protein